MKRKIMFGFFDSLPKLIRNYEQAVGGDNIINIRKLSLEIVELVENTTKDLLDFYRNKIKGEK